MEHLPLFQLTLKQSLMLHRDRELNLNLSSLLFKFVDEFFVVVDLRFEISLFIVAFKLLNHRICPP